jgi:hypothetical protein
MAPPQLLARCGLPQPPDSSAGIPPCMALAHFESLTMAPLGRTSLATNQRMHRPAAQVRFAKLLCVLAISYGCQLSDTLIIQPGEVKVNSRKLTGCLQTLLSEPDGGATHAYAYAIRQSDGIDHGVFARRTPAHTIHHRHYSTALLGLSTAARGGQPDAERPRTSSVRILRQVEDIIRLHDILCV